MSEQTYTYGAKYICIRQSDDQPGAQYEPIAQCLSGHYDSPSWEGHAAFLVEAANSYASSQAEIERLRTVGQKLLDHWDENSGPEKRDEFEGVEYWSPSGRMVSTEFIAELRAALSGSKD